ncbi:MAG: hypothetical protein Ct9H300mP31_07520 [Acidimicrobiaceae bacterium]|nr:MAG: hypothetical protein Ct9H300mP31_07520 [Acidimicrobiaceae bacterium]
MVTFPCGRDPEDAVVVDLAEFRAIRMLGDAGLVPPLRHTIRYEPNTDAGPSAGPCRETMTRWS